MSKAMLIMDMPSSCSECKLKSRVHGISNVTHCCNLAEGIISLDKGFEERLDNCPLRELPQKREMRFLDDASEFYRQGYNACIDEILKGEEHETECGLHLEDWVRHVHDGGEELHDRNKIYDYVKTQINPYGKPFQGSVKEFGYKIMDYIKNMPDVPEINVGENEEFCEWEYDEFEKSWRTQCGVLFKLNESDSEITRYCSYCGRKIK